MNWKILTLFCLTALFARPAQAQVNVPIPPLPKVDVSGPYLWGLGGHEIINVKTSADGRNPYERCAIFDARTVEILNRTQAPPLRAGDIRVVNKDGRPWIVVRKYILTDVKPQDAKAEGTSVPALADKWARSVRKALPDVAPKGSQFGV
jgi:hypothetical protein